MGKTNKANRTKGNTRPSSSGHSAQLLSLSGKSLSGYIGFDALEKDIPSYIPVTGQHSSDASDLSVDSDLRMVMRKMLKRDSITRLKAMQEFGDLCAEKDKDTVKNVLPFWPRLFNKLALDYDRRIREATHQANGKLITNVKREIAPYLKNIMGIWLLGQNDLHAPAASAAQATFTATFPKTKQSEALMHCKSEIFSYFKDNLFEQTAKTMSEPNSASAEDIENKYTLVISATLQAMKLFLITISPNEIPNVRDDYFNIVAENKFWKYAKNKEAQIRGSWYAFISYICHVKPDIFAEMEKKLVAAVFGCLAESNPIVAPSVWESALHIVVNFENCWQGISIHKVVVPQLWTLFNGGGRGNAHVIFPCILPFLSKLPREVISKDTFLPQFFTCLRHSLSTECVKSSIMECDAVLTTFIECLQYVSFNVLEAKEGSALLEKIISDHVLPLVEASFYDNKYCHLATSKFYPLLGSLIQKIESKCLRDDEELAKIYGQTLILFWNNIYNIFCKLFHKKPEEKSRISLYVTYFFNSIFSPTAIIKPEKSKVRFKDDSQLEDVIQVLSESLPSEELYNKMPLTFKHVIRFIKVLCKETDESINLCYLKILDEILACTLNTSFLKDILKSYEETDDCIEKASVTFFNKVILNWVSGAQFDRTSITCIADIVFSLCSSVSEDDALDMLNTCCKVKNPVFLDCILNKGLGIYINEPVIQSWLQNPVLVESVLNEFREMINKLIQNKKDELHILAQKNVLLTCLVNKDLQGTLKNNEAIEKILQIWIEFHEDGLTCENVNCFIQVSCDIIEAILMNCQICWSYGLTDVILSKLFHWNLNAEKYDLSERTCEVLSKVWSAGIFSSCRSSVAITRNDSFILSAAKQLNSSLNYLQSTKQASRTTFEILNLLYTVEEVQMKLPDSYTCAFVLSKLLENILPSEIQWKDLRGNLILTVVPSFLENKIFYRLPEEKNFVVSHEEVYKLFMATDVISYVFTEEIENHSHIEGPYFEQYLKKYIPDLLWCLSYCKGNGYITEDTKLNVDILEENCKKILLSFPCEVLQDVMQDMFYQTVHDGLYWGLPFQLLLEMIKKLHPECIIFSSKLMDEIAKMDCGEKPLITQILSHHIPTERKIFYVKSLLQDLNHVSSFSCGGDAILDEISCLVQDPKVCADEDVHQLLSNYFSRVLPFDRLKELDFSFTFPITSLLSSIQQYAPDIMTESIWKHIQVFLSSSIEVAKCVEFNKPEELMLLFEISSLYLFSFKFVNTAQSMEIRWSPSMSDKMNDDFILLFIHVGDVIKKFHPLPHAFENVLTSLLRAVEVIPQNALFNYIIQSPPTIEKLADNSKDVKASTTLDLLTTILLSDIQQLQLAAHTILIKIMPLFSESLSNMPKNESEDSNEDEEEKVPPKLLPLVDTLNLLNELMESMLGDFKIGDCCLVMPNTDAYAFVSAYLFAWLQMLEFISSSPSQVRSGYIAHLEETKLLSSLFSNVCRLMPENPMSSFKKGSNSDTPKKENLISLFLQQPEIDSGNPSAEEIQVIACYVFCTALRRVPASVRTWWNNLDKKSADIVNRFTSKYISGILCGEEIQTVHNNGNLFKNMVVKARLGSREVIAIYTVDDFAIELCVQLPSNYPLGPITAEKRGKIVIPQQEWRHWLMQLTTVLNYQNGSILDGLNIWKKNLDKKFEGVEECMICYYILHSSSLKLPKLSCHVCRKKFHSACLYKWFHSSNNFTCPLCRNEFVI